MPIGVKVIRRNSFIWNISLFLLLTPYFIHIIESLKNGYSAVSLEQGLEFARSRALLIIPIFLCLYSILNAKKYSRLICSVYLFGVSIFTFSKFLTDFDKIILILNIGFASMSYVFVLFLNEEMKAAYYTPGFSRFSIGKTDELPVKGVITTDDEKKYTVNITNWDEYGCFLRLSQDENVAIKGRVVINLKYMNKDFAELGSVVTKYGNGYGIRFVSAKQEDSSVHNWSEFYSIISDRGYRPKKIGSLL